MRFDRRAKPKAQPVPGKFVLAIVLAVISIAIAVTYIRNWPVMNASPSAVNLSGTGVSPEVEAAINRGRGQAAPIPMPLTPDTADRYAGVPGEPETMGYSQALRVETLQH